jgi:hypothetical protein
MGYTGYNTHVLLRVLLISHCHMGYTVVITLNVKTILLVVIMYTTTALVVYMDVCYAITVTQRHYNPVLRNVYDVPFRNGIHIVYV